MAYAEESADHDLMSLADHATANVEEAAAASKTPVHTLIAKEINRIEGQLSLMVADVQNHYEVELSKAKAELDAHRAKISASLDALTSTYSFVGEHKLAITLLALGVFILGLAVGALI